MAQGIEGRTRVVFVTAYDEFAVAAFEQQALDYVLKPVQADRLARTVERLQRELAASHSPAPGAARRRARERRRWRCRRPAPGRRPAPASRRPAPAPLRYVRASQGDVTHQVDVADVLFFHADDKYTCVTTATAEHLIRTTITELAASCPRKA